MRKGVVKVNDYTAGVLWEDDEGFHFKYDSEYLNCSDAIAVSLTLPLHAETYHSETLFPFFDGLIPEGWLLNIVVENWKIDLRDRMSLLLATGSDCIGNVSVLPYE